MKLSLQLKGIILGTVSGLAAIGIAFAAGERLQPKPGAAPKPGPMKVAPEILPTVLGITEVNYHESAHSLAVVDTKLG